MCDTKATKEQKQQFEEEAKWVELIISAQLKKF
jgi:hypothetical protein